MYCLSMRWGYLLSVLQYFNKFYVKWGKVLIEAYYITFNHIFQRILVIIKRLFIHIKDHHLYY